MKGLLTDSLSLYQKNFFFVGEEQIRSMHFFDEIDFGPRKTFAGGERQLYQLATSFYTDFRLKGSLTQGVFDIHLIALVIVRNDK